MGIHMSENSKGSDSTVVEKSFYLQDQRDISLVDVVAIVFRQWKVAVATFVVMMLVVIALALMLDKTYTYSSVYKLAEQQESDNNQLGALERPSGVAEKIRTLYTAGAVRSLLKRWGEESLDFSVDVSSPKDTLFMVLSSNATQEDAEHVKELHQRSLQQALEDQQATLKQRQQSLEKRRRNLKQQLDALDDNVASGELAATYANQLADVEAKLTALAQGEIVQLAERSVKPVGLGSLWVLMLGLVVSVIVALVSAWLSHFLGLVSETLRGNSQKS